MPKITFTQARLRDISPPAKGRTLYFDDKCPGLAFQVTAKGACSFYYRRWSHGSMSIVFIGKFPDVGLAAARDQAALLNAGAVSGTRPQRTGRSLTLAALWERYKSIWLSRKRAGTRRGDESRYNTCLKSLEHLTLERISRDKVLAMHAAVGRSRGHVSANRAVQLLRALYNFAAKTLRLKVDNPAASVPLFPEHERTRRLTADELPRFFAALAEEPQDWQDFFLLCLYTGARRGNVQRMRVEEIDLLTGVWTIPKEEFKTGRTKEIVLAQPALEILRRRVESNREWVFSCWGKLLGRRGHLTEPKKSWVRVCDRAKLENLHIHDLRRSLASWQADLGTSLPIIGATLGQDDPASTKIYARVDLEPVRAAVEAAVKAMREAGSPRSSSAPAHE